MKKSDLDQCFYPASRLAEMPEKQVVHQYNDNAVRLTRSIGDLAGLVDMGLHIVRIETGRETTEHHTHGQDEEFVHLISGRAIARLGDEEVHMESGDTMLFPKNSPAHSMHNPFPEDLVYLMGGTRSPIDVCTYPNLQRRQYRIDGEKEYVAIQDVTKV